MTHATLIDDTFSPSFSRWLAVLLPSLLVTLGLIYIMQKLIFVEYQYIEEEDTPQIDPVIYEERIIETLVDPRPEKPKEVQEEPAAPPKPDLDSGDFDITIPQLTLAKTLPTFGSPNNFDSVPVAAYLVTAKYPPRALERGVEGYVDLRFDINKTGATENIQVIGASPEGVFERSAVAAAQRWKYKPYIKNGEPHDFPGITQRVTFQISKQ